MRDWSNEPKLDLLRAARMVGYDNVLIFNTGTERAKVVLEDGDIKEVIFVGDENLEPVVIKRTDAHGVVVGRGNNEMRDVIHFLKPGGPALTMRLGITKHRGLGTWSSLPHDFELNTEPGFEEVFFYLLKGRNQSAIQVGKGVWHDNTPVDDVWKVYNRTFGTVPMGYHPVVGEPGVHVSYVWCYLAKHKRWEKIK